MSKIINFTKGASGISSRSGKPVEVECIYDVQVLPDGSKMVVIKTYNKASKNAGISQAIHFTKDSALKLIEIFKKEFNL